RRLWSGFSAECFPEQSRKYAKQPFVECSRRFPSATLSLRRYKACADQRRVDSRFTTGGDTGRCVTRFTEHLSTFRCLLLNSHEDSLRLMEQGARSGGAFASASTQVVDRGTFREHRRCLDGAWQAATQA